MSNKFNYNEFRVREGEEVRYCLKCGEKAAYLRWGYYWCEEHKKNLQEDPEALEEIVIERLGELGK